MDWNKPIASGLARRNDEIDAGPVMRRILPRVGGQEFRVGNTEVGTYTMTERRKSHSPAHFAAPLDLRNSMNSGGFNDMVKS